MNGADTALYGHPADEIPLRRYLAAHEEHNDPEHRQNVAVGDRAAVPEGRNGFVLTLGGCEGRIRLRPEEAWAAKSSACRGLASSMAGFGLMVQNLLRDSWVVIDYLFMGCALC